MKTFWEEIIPQIQYCFTFFSIFVYYASLNIIFLFRGEIDPHKKFTGRSFVSIIIQVLTLLLITYYIRLTRGGALNTSYFFDQTLTKRMDHKMEDINVFFKHEIKLIEKYKRVICNICKTFKPPRTQHCSICNKCFMKSEGHSSSLGICLHFFNNQFFVPFSIIKIFLILSYFIVAFIRPKRNQFGIFLAVCAIPIISCDVYDLYLSIRNILMNETNIERLALNRYLDGDISDKYIFQQGLIEYDICLFDRTVLNPYYLDPKSNIIQVYGNLYFIFSTNFTSLGDGITFPVNYESEINLFNTGEI
ncbi:Palmitoyltransferase PFA3 [Cucumispora dikerogammari]|nr:Palmitoyltransferase PFA3 [Cucumispora dikerogammari]